MEEQNQSYFSDTHAHLSSRSFTEDLHDVIGRAFSSNVKKIISISCDIHDSINNIEISNIHNFILPTVGIHPTSVHEPGASDWQEQLTAMASHPRVAAIGEIGLDYYHPPRDGSSEILWKQKQKEFLEFQLQLALDSGLPVVIHQRSSEDDVHDVLANFPRIRAVLHCFSGDHQAAETALSRGYFVSFTGILTFPKSEELRKVAAEIPLNRVMIETDCPYLAPVPYRGKRCEPAMVTATAATLATLHGLDPLEIASRTSENANHFFRRQL